jgi:hypothetical protein
MCPIRKSRSTWRRAISADDGAALVIALMAVLLLAALGLMLVLNSAAEVMLASHFRLGQEAFYAADGVAERVIDELAGSADWSNVLTGVEGSAFVDGGAADTRILSDGSTIDLAKASNLLNCAHAAPCTIAEMEAITADRPWGPDNPRWRLHAYGLLDEMVSTHTINSNMYVALWVADDQSDGDSDPSTDSNHSVALHAESFGPGGVHKILEMNVGRAGTSEAPTGVKVLAWRELR